MIRNRRFGALVAILAATPAFGQVEASATKGTKPYFWFSMWPDKVAQYDPATDQVVRKVTLKHGLQWSKTLSHDKKQFWVITDRKTKVEVVDLELGAVIDVHDFADDDRIIRVSSVQEIPGGTHWYVRVDRVKREVDHFKVEKPQYLLYDVAKKKVDKRLDELPKAIRRGAKISPDGSKWHVFGSDLTIVDPKTNEEEAKIDLTTPVFSGMGAIRVYGEDFYEGRNPDAYRMLFRMTDPVQKKRTVFGVVDIDMQKRRVVDLQEWGPSPSSYWSFKMSRDKKRAGAFGRASDGLSKLAYFDLENGRKLRESFEQFRPRRWLSAISPDGKRLYVGGAGNDFVIFDEGLERVKTVLLDADLLGGVTVIDG